MMLLADARLPTGAHTQSAGLEPALAGGLQPARIPDYLETRLRTVTTVEAGAAVVARYRVEARAEPLAPALAEVEAAWRARTASPALRAAGALLGRGYLRLAQRLWPGAPAITALTTPPMASPPSRAVVLGAVAGLLGLSAAQTVRLIGYEDAQTVAAAALKLTPLDPAVPAAWVVGAMAAIERMVDQVGALTEPDDIPARAAPLLEQWAEQHAGRTQRLFRA